MRESLSGGGSDGANRSCENLSSASSGPEEF